MCIKLLYGNALVAGYECEVDLADRCLVQFADPDGLPSAVSVILEVPRLSQEVPTYRRPTVEAEFAGDNLLCVLERERRAVGRESMSTWAKRGRRAQNLFAAVASPALRNRK